MPCDQRKIFVVVPTIRADSFDKFFINWLTLFLKHRVTLVVVQDGPDPHIDVFEFKNAIVGTTDEFKRKRVAMGARAVLGMENVDMFYNFSDSIRNAGFAYAIMNGASVVISLDDDVAPVGDTIQDHINALDNSYPISWMNTANEHYMRGFPYSVRHEAECVLSHGGWTSVADFDGQTQLKLESESETNTIPAVTIRRMPVPKGVLFPFCAMNFAFKRKFAPWVYQAPAIDDIQRFSDIWSGICMKSM
ncbi:reversibly glycosylated polypeptide, partial [uncultured Caudovirales phage]